MLGVDRLDYIKGVPQKSLAFEHLLHKHPEWIGEVVLVQVAVPSRQDLEETPLLMEELSNIADRVNDEFGSPDYQPIDLKHTSLDFDELLAYYALSDICIVSSTRDGMNLVSYEYIASQPANKQGVLVLSEFAGAAQNLEGALLFNSWNTVAAAETVHKVLTMSRREKVANFEKVRWYVLGNTSANWGKSFLSDLSAVVGEGKLMGESRRDSGIEMMDEDDDREAEDCILSAGRGSPKGKFFPRPL
jgi:trehalose 6-phosphate synthase